MVDRVRDRMANMVDDAIVIGTDGRRVMKELSLCLGSDSYIYIYALEPNRMPLVALCTPVMIEY